MTHLLQTAYLNPDGTFTLLLGTGLAYRLRRNGAKRLALSILEQLT